MFDLVDRLFYLSILLFFYLALGQRSDFFHALELLVKEVLNVLRLLLENVLLVSCDFTNVTSFFIRLILDIVVVNINYNGRLFFLE